MFPMILGRLCYTGGVKYPLVALCLTVAAIIGLGFGLRQPRTISHSILDTAVERGVEALARAHTPYQYDDPYLKFVYPGEDIACRAPGCRLTYRLLDAYFALTMIESRLTTNERAAIADQSQERDSAFADIGPRWRNAPIINTIMSTAADSGGIALDTFCILGTLTHDQGLARRSLDYLTPDNNWIADDYYQDDRWRNIADETWCLRLAAETGILPDRLGNMIDRKIIETREFLKSNEPANAKLGVLYHMLLLLSTKGAPDQPEVRAEFQSDAAAIAQTGALDQDPIALGNLLEAMAASGYSDQQFLAVAARHLLALQGADAAWQNSGANRYPVFTTLRALAGLTAYRGTL